ncbi:MAG: TIGR04076 family protein [Candidatus Aminicenantes bacterium]|nr:TIGR04076 family protein [Candidatus Aminicenantes bacterium]MDH5742933.1 TIGR04076 family protein [Candidatus Aminicenantes bacterium]
MKRREFCKAVPCAAIGGLCPSALQGFFSNKLSNTEVSMEGKITSVEVKVISQKGTCALGHKIGDVVKITESGIEGKICIHALYSMLPAVFAMMFDAQFPWLKDPDKKTHACPDAYNPVVFEIMKIREK